MRVLVDYRPALKDRTGVGEYVHQFVRALPDVVGDAGPLADPAADGALSAAIERVIDDSAFAASSISKGLERSRLFNWDDMARGVYTANQRAIDRRCASA